MLISLQTFLSSYIINIFKCNGVHYAVYDFEWFSLNPKEARDLIPCIIKFGEPVCFTAGKVFPVTLLLFSNVHYTYFNIIGYEIEFMNMSFINM